MANENCVAVVEELNGDVFDRDENAPQFTYVTSGYFEAILFDETCLWDSENDERVYFNGNEREPLATFVRREFNKYADRLQAIKFADVPPEPKEDDEDENG